LAPRPFARDTSARYSNETRLPNKAGQGLGDRGTAPTRDGAAGPCSPGRRLPMSRIVVAVFLLVLCMPSAASPNAQADWRSLDGYANNLRHPDWGEAGTAYLRVAEPNYADGIARMVAGPPARYISNRVFNDVGQNLFSENGVSQWAWAWGQFLDHDFGLRDETPAESAPIAFDRSDALEQFESDLPIEFARTPAAPGTGVTTP